MKPSLHPALVHGIGDPVKLVAWGIAHQLIHRAQALKARNPGHIKHYVRVVHDPLPGEVRLKTFLQDEAARLNVSTHAVFQRISRGNYPGLSKRRVNGRVVFVKQIVGSRRKRG